MFASEFKSMHLATKYITDIFPSAKMLEDVDDVYEVFEISASDYNRVVSKRRNPPMACMNHPSYAIVFDYKELPFRSQHH
jgi:hypothetical protein